MKSSAVLSGSFAPTVQFEKLEIHTVFRRFSNFHSCQNLSLITLADFIIGYLKWLSFPVRALHLSSRILGPRWRKFFGILRKNRKRRDSGHAACRLPIYLDAFDKTAPIATRNIWTRYRRSGRGILKGAAFRQRPLSRLLLKVLAETRTLPPEGSVPKASRSFGTYA